MKKILIVDDDQTVRDSFSELLKGKYELSIFSDGYQAYTELTTGETDVDLFLLDINLPGQMTGIRLLEEIRQMIQFKNTPVLIVSSSLTKDHIEHVNSLDLTSYSLKPVDKKVFLNVVENLIKLNK